MLNRFIKIYDKSKKTPLLALYFLIIVISLSGCDSSSSPVSDLQDLMMMEELGGSQADQMQEMTPTDDQELNSDFNGITDGGLTDAEQPLLLEFEAQGDPSLARFAGGCFLVQLTPNSSRSDSESSVESVWIGGGEEPTLISASDMGIPFTLRATALGEYLLYTANDQYLSLDEGRLVFQTALKVPLEGYSEGELKQLSSKDQA